MRCVPVIAALVVGLGVGTQSTLPDDKAVIYALILRYEVAQCCKNSVDSLVVIGYTKPEYWHDFQREKLISDMPESHKSAATEFFRRSKDRTDVTHLLPPGYRVVEPDLSGTWVKPGQHCTLWVSPIGFDPQRKHAVVASGYIPPRRSLKPLSITLYLVSFEDGKWCSAEKGWRRINVFVD
jgi:hypothetical protein